MGSSGCWSPCAAAELVDRLVVMGTNFHYDGVFPFELDEDSPMASQLFEAYAARSPDGPDHFGELFQKFLAMATTGQR